MTEAGGFFMTTYLLLWVLVLAESVLLFVLLRQIGHAYLSQLPVSEREGIPVGGRLPDVPTVTSDGTRTLSTFVTTRPYTAVVLVTPTCSICRGAIDALRSTTAELPWLAAAVLIEGTSLDRYSDVTAWGNAGLITDKAARKLQVRATPFAFIVDSEAQVVAKGIVNTTDDLHGLLVRAKDAIDAADQDRDRHEVERGGAQPAQPDPNAIGSPAR